MPMARWITMIVERDVDAYDEGGGIHAGGLVVEVGAVA